MTTTQQLKLIIAGLLLALAGTIFYYNQEIVDNSVCMDYNQYQPSTLKTGLVGDMVSIYRDKQLKSIKNSPLAMDDAYSIWFDLDTIKKFIYHIEKGVEQNAATGTTNKLGLRFYYASYPDHSTWGTDYKDLSDMAADPSRRNYEYKHSLVLLPTIHVGGNELDFNPFNAATFTTGLPKYTKPINKEPLAIDTSPAAAEDVFAISGTTVARNHGMLCPPGNATGLGF